MLHAFNIVAWTKLMTLTNESTYFAFQMIWEEIVNLFLFHGVPGWCWCGPSGGDLSPAARTSHSPNSPWLSCWSLVTSQAGVKLSLAPAASISRSRSSLMAACLETLRSPTCCPALAPTLSRSQVQEKVEPRSHLSSPVSSQVNTKQILWINEFHSDSGEAVFVIIHIFILPIVQDIFENYYFNKRELNEPTYFSYNRHGKNSLLLWGEISHAHILNSQSPVSGLQTDLFYCSISFCEQVATVPGCIYFIQFAALLIHDIEEFSYKRTVLWIFYSVFTAGKLMSSMLYS